jgi:hypothetical protein
LPEDLCAKNLTKIGPNYRVKAIFFSRTRRPLPSKPINEDQTVKPRK